MTNAVQLRFVPFEPLDVDPVAEALLDVAKRASMEGKVDASIFCLDEARSRSPQSARIYAALARAYAEQHVPQKAAGYAQCAAELEPLRGDYWNLLATQHMALGNWAEALDALEKRVALAPGDAVAKTKLQEVRNRMPKKPVTPAGASSATFGSKKKKPPGPPGERRASERRHGG